MPTLPLTTPTLPGPVPYCPSGSNPYQQLVNDAFGNSVAILSASLGGVWVATTPPADTTTYPIWYRTYISGGLQYPYTPFLWKFVGGVWVSPNPIIASSNERKIWIGAAGSAVWSYDGGDNLDPAVTPPTPNAGAMWDIDTAFAGLVPGGVGTIGTGTPLALLASVGEEKHTLTLAELPNLPGGQNFYEFFGGGGGAFDLNSTTPGSRSAGYGQVTLGSGTAHNNVQPTIGVYFIKRTARVNYRF